MATSLGSLVVSLGLNAAEFTTGLTKSEREAQKFARSIDKGIAAAVNVATIALASLATGAVAAVVAIDQLAKQAGNFKDLEEKTGASAESLASFSVSAQVAGTDVATVAGAMNKLAKGLTGVDDESKAAGAALTALGIPIEEFKRQDPATQMEIVAKALAGFEDGATKSAVAMALFGKSGAELLPFFKELASGAGRIVILNQKLIEQADEYADKQARAKAELNLYAQVAASQALPAITALTDVTKTFVQQLLGLDAQGKQLRDTDAVAKFAESSVKALAFAVDSVQALGRVLRFAADTTVTGLAMIAAAGSGEFKEAIRLGEEWKRRAKADLETPLFSAGLNERLDQARRDAAMRAQEDRGFKPKLPQLQFGGAVTPGKAQKDTADEAAKFIKQLEQQRQASMDLGPEMEILIKLYALMGKGLGTVTPEQEKYIRFLAAEAGASAEAKKAAEEKKKADEADARVVEELNRTIVQQIVGFQNEARAIDQVNEQIKEQIAFYKGGDAAVRALTDAKLAKRIADEEELRNVLLGIQNSELYVAGINEVIDALKRQQSAHAELDIARQAAEDKKAIQDLGNTVSDSLTNAWTGFFEGTVKAKDALRSFLADMQQMLIRSALKGLFNKLLGVEETGPNIFATIGKLIGIGGSATGAAGGAAGGAAMTVAGTTLTTAGTGLGLSATALTGAATALTTAALALSASSVAKSGADAAGLLFKVGSAFQGPGLGMAAVGGTLMGGTTLVGEQGPELARFPVGTRITAHHNLTGGGGPTIVQNIHVPRGADSSTLRQSAKRAFALAASEMRRG